MKIIIQHKNNVMKKSKYEYPRVKILFVKSFQAVLEL